MGHERGSLPHKYYLTEEQRHFYDEYGYLVVKNLIEDDTLAAMRKRFADICNNVIPKGSIIVTKDTELAKVKTNPEDWINKLNFVNNDPVFLRYTEHPRLVHVVTQLIGNDISLYNGMMINKPPGSPWHPPHQDIFHIPIRPFDKFVSSWTAIDPVTHNNGCLFVVPGSHKKRKLYREVHVPSLVNRLYFKIHDVDEAAPESKRVSIAPMQPGDTIFIHALTVHGSWPNRSDDYRKAVSNIYASNECHHINTKGTAHEPFEDEINNMFKEIQPEADRLTLKQFWDMYLRPVNVRCLKSNL